MMTGVSISARYRLTHNSNSDDRCYTIDVLFPLVGWLIEGFVYPLHNRQMMIAKPEEVDLFWTQHMVPKWWSLYYTQYFRFRYLFLHLYTIFLPYSIHKARNEAFMLWLFHKLHHSYEAAADSLGSQFCGGFYSDGGTPIAGWFILEIV